MKRVLPFALAGRRVPHPKHWPALFALADDRSPTIGESQ